MIVEIGEEVETVMEAGVETEVAKDAIDVTVEII